MFQRSKTLITNNGKETWSYEIINKMKIALYKVANEDMECKQADDDDQE